MSETSTNRTRGETWRDCKERTSVTKEKCFGCDESVDTQEMQHVLVRGKVARRCVQCRAVLATVYRAQGCEKERRLNE